MKIIEKAGGEIGYLEKASNADLNDRTANAGNKNYTKYWAEIHPALQGQPWCACFCVWCARKAGIGSDILPSIYACSELVKWFKKYGQWYTAPQPGDLIFFGGSDGRSTHVGIVTAVGGIIETIEGNTSSEPGVVANGGAVARKHYDAGNKRILGYGRPKYTE